MGQALWHYLFTIALGLEAAGFETVFATDIDHHSCITLERGKERSIKLGLPFLRHATIRQADVLTLNSSELMKQAGVKPGETDLLPEALHAKRLVSLGSAWVLMIPVGSCQSNICDCSRI